MSSAGAILCSVVTETFVERRDLKEMRESVVQIDIWTQSFPDKGSRRCKSLEEGTNILGVFPEDRGALMGWDEGV